MSKQRSEYRAQQTVANLSKVLAYLFLTMVGVAYFFAPLELAPSHLKWWGVLANAVTLAFAAISVYGVSHLRRKKMDLGDWLFYGLLGLLTIAAFIISLKVYM